MSRRAIACAVAALLALPLLAGCGGSSSGSGSTSTSASPARSTASGAATVKTASSSLGTILVDASGDTLYLFERDSGPQSTCSGSCAQNWPPLTTNGMPQAGSGATAAQLGTSKRGDGTTQVTYAGHPLYSYTGDGAAGDTNGQGVDAFGAKWFVLAPSGSKIEGNSDTGSGGGGY